MGTEKVSRKSWISIYPFSYIGDNVENEEGRAIGVGNQSE